MREANVGPRRLRLARRETRRALARREERRTFACLLKISPCWFPSFLHTSEKNRFCGVGKLTAVAFFLPSLLRCSVRAVMADPPGWLPSAVLSFIARFIRGVTNVSCLQDNPKGKWAISLLEMYAERLLTNSRSFVMAVSLPPQERQTHHLRK